MKVTSQLLLTFLLNACWQISLVTATVALCTLLVRHCAIRYQHLLWAAALVLCLVVPLGTSSFALRLLTWEAAPQQALTALAISEPLDSLPLDQAGALRTPPPTNSTVLVSAKLARLLLALYLLFLGYRAVRLLRAWQRTQAIRKSAYPVERRADLTAILEKCQRAFPGARVSLLFSDSVVVPITVGFRDPLVILPSQLLCEPDGDLLASAIGHEIVHVQRRDYLLNLIYEFLYLPLSFHPAAALVRRRINQTRELCCDELVAERLLEADVYARSLVRLAGSAPSVHGLAATTSVGIADADILEVRIMSLLNRSKAGLRGKKVLFIAVSLMLAVPCAAATVFAVAFDINRQNPGVAELGTAQGERRAKLVYHTEPVYTQDAREQNIEGKVGLALTVGTDGLVQDVQVVRPLYPSLDESAIATVRQWRFEPYLKDGQPQPKRLTVELYFSAYSGQGKPEREEREQKERAERDMKERAERDPQLREQLEREAIELRAKRQSELVRAAKVTMDQAIQIAISQYPGKVLECNLVGEHWEAPGKLGNDSQVFYHIVVYLSNEANPTTTHVLVNALDGRIMKAEREGKPILGGQLNDKAISLPAPAYPAIARAAGASGSVIVEVTIDENGSVIAAKAISGHPLLQAAAVTAARSAQFAPTKLSGEPVKVKGLLTYDFAVQ